MLVAEEFSRRLDAAWSRLQAAIVAKHAGSRYPRQVSQYEADHLATLEIEALAARIEQETAKRQRRRT